MREVPPIYRLFPSDQFNMVQRPGIMISASTDKDAALVAKNILHAVHSGGELWADNQIIRQYCSPDQDEAMEHVWSPTTRAWQLAAPAN